MFQFVSFIKILQIHRNKIQTTVNETKRAISGLISSTFILLKLFSLLSIILFIFLKHIFNFILSGVFSFSIYSKKFYLMLWLERHFELDFFRFIVFREPIRTWQEEVFYSLLLARLESAYSLIWGAQEILGKGGGETLALL